MEIIKKITNIGSSLGIILDKIVLNTLKLKKGDNIKLEIKKIK